MSNFTNAQTVAELAMERVKQREAKDNAELEAKAAKEAVFNHPNASFIISLEKLDIDQVKSFSNDIAKNSKTKWELLNVFENEQKGYCIVSYIDGSMPTSYKEEVRNKKTSCEKCLEVNFLLFFEGENKDLDIKGIKQYRFRNVSGKYLDLFPTWKNTFRPDADMEKTVDDYSSKELVQKAIGIRYKLEKQGDIWTIANNSNLYDYFKSKSY
jgi:hypothetical protein